MIPRFVIFVETVNGDVIRAFTWCKDALSGIARAEKDAKDFGVSSVKIWAEPLGTENV